MNRAKQHANYKDEWETPPELMNPVWRRWGCFDLDVASQRHNSRGLRCFTRADDAFQHDWCGQNVWMNPPYGRNIEAWIARALLEVTLGHAKRLVALLPASTSARWFKRAFGSAAEVYFLTGRVSFMLDGVSQKDNPGGNVIMVFKLGPTKTFASTQCWDWRE